LHQRENCGESVTNGGHRVIDVTPKKRCPEELRTGEEFLITPSKDKRSPQKSLMSNDVPFNFTSAEIEETPPAPISRSPSSLHSADLLDGHIEVLRSIAELSVPDLLSNSDREMSKFGASAPYEPSQDTTETFEIATTPCELAKSRYYASSGGGPKPLARRNTFGFTARTATKIKMFFELINVGNYIWVFFFNLCFDPGARWTIYVQSVIYVCYFSHIATYIYYEKWPDEYDEETWEVKNWKLYFPTMQNDRNTTKRRLYKLLYILGFGKSFQYYFAFKSNTDEDFDNEINGAMWLSYSELFVFYVPTVLLQTIQVEIGGYTISSLPTLISFYICTIKNVVMMIFAHNYLYWNWYFKIALMVSQVAADVFFRTYTFAIMTVHISYWTAFTMPILYCSLNFMDNDWFETYFQRIYYGILFTPLHTVSNLQYLYSSSMSSALICLEHYFRFAIGAFVISYQHDSFGNIFSILIMTSFFWATFAGMYILRHHEIFKTRDEIT